MPVHPKLFPFDLLPWYKRLPCKWAILAFTVFAVCFPYPGATLRHLRHCLSANALVEPAAPALQPWVDELRAELPPDLPPRDALRRVEAFVYRKVPYDWDWNTWGLSDYLPTVDEVIAKGREDCDGRAVIAASLLRNFGLDAKLVTDFAHVWVQTSQGDTMGPGRRKAFVATDRGLQFDFRALAEVPTAFSYGLAVFPFVREFIVLLVGWWLMVDRRIDPRRAVTALELLVVGLLLLREGGRDYRLPVPWMQGAGAVAFVVAIAAMLLRGRKSPP